MPRTFSLSRLLLGVTLFCVLCGLIVNYPQIALATVLITCLVVPTLLVWLGLRSISRRRVALAISVGAGALVFPLIGPGAISGPSIVDFLEFYKIMLVPLAIPMAISAFLFGLAELLYEAIA